MSQQRRKQKPRAQAVSKASNRTATPEPAAVAAPELPLREEATIANENGMLGIGLAAAALVVVLLLTVMIIMAAT
jgi:hypothetical protein